MPSKIRVGRNDPCPCGSGKKFKKCCGLSVNQPDCFSINRTVAYKGPLGRLREAFCVDYLEFKKKLTREMEDELRQEVAARGKTISCSQGCSCCCHLFVTASLQDCEGIVYYLYHNEGALEHFIRAFPIWQSRILKIEHCFRNINILHEKVTSEQATDEERSVFQTELALYAGQVIPCPFLVRGSCSIYEARPLVCARVISCSPADWCRPTHPDHNKVEYLKAKPRPSMPYLKRPEYKMIYSSMPFLVYRLLAEGYGALFSLPGLENLKDEALADLEMLAVLRDSGLLTGAIHP